MTDPLRPALPARAVTGRNGASRCAGAGASIAGLASLVGLALAGATPADRRPDAARSAPAAAAPGSGPDVSATPRREGRAPIPVVLPRPERTPTPAETAIAEGDNEAFGGWDSERLASAAGERLARLGRLLASTSAVSPDDLAPLAQEDVACRPLRPATLAEVFSEGLISVRRPGALPDPLPGGDPVHRGREGLAAALEPLRHGGGVRPAFKVVGIEPGEGTFTTRVLVQLFRTGPEGAAQENMTWLVRWVRPAASLDEPPRLAWIGVESFEEARLEEGAGALFEDATAAAMGGEASYAEQVLPGVSSWAERVPRAEDMSLFGHNGIAVGDVDADGLEDLYVCDEGGLPNRLYLQQPDGTVRDAAAAAGVDFVEATSSALLVDLDNDGDQDLAVASDPVVVFAENDGRGRFALRARVRAADEAYSMAAADYDLDGDLDVYVTSYRSRGGPGRGRSIDFGGDVPVPYYDARNGGRNVLLRNDGAFRFADATASAGLEENNDRFSFAAAWEDYDDDGDPDLYVANDFGRNNLYRNDRGRFADVAGAAGVEDIASGMSVSFGDYDRDGRMDLHVGNMFSAAGNRVTYQRRFAPGHDPGAVALLRRTARGNSLFRNAGDGTFEDVTGSAGVAMGRWAWSSPFVDLNNDGLEDLVVTNGFFTEADPGDL